LVEVHLPQALVYSELAQFWDCFSNPDRFQLEQRDPELISRLNPEHLKD
jgi:hypothetical protein